MVIKMRFQRFGKATLGLACLIFVAQSPIFVVSFFWTSVGWTLSSALWKVSSNLNSRPWPNGACQSSDRRSRLQASPTHVLFCFLAFQTVAPVECFVP